MGLKSSQRGIGTTKVCISLLHPYSYLAMLVLDSFIGFRDRKNCWLPPSFRSLHCMGMKPQGGVIHVFSSSRVSLFLKCVVSACRLHHYYCRPMDSVFPRPTLLPHSPTSMSIPWLVLLPNSSRLHRCRFSLHQLEKRRICWIKAPTPPQTSAETPYFT